MLVIIYSDYNKCEARKVWTLADHCLPNIKPESVTKLFANSFEKAYLCKVGDSNCSEWYGEEAQKLFTMLKEKQKDIYK